MELQLLAYWRGKLKAGDRLKEVSIDGGMILKCILNKWDAKAWTG
jgi:hypothetical protein